MINLRAYELLDVIDDMAVLWERCLDHPDNDPPDDGLKPADVYKEARASVHKADRVLNSLPISRHMHRAVEEAKYWFKDESAPSYFGFDSMETHLSTFRKAILTEFEGVRFLFIGENRVELYESDAPLFGVQVEDCFPDASDDIAAAGRLIAVEEWTAVVFHLMRVAEHGLRGLARELEVPLSDRVDLESWKVVIDQIDKAIKAFEETQPKSAEKSERLSTYSQAAVTLRHFKNAWRNHVAHARGKYDERDALNLWSYVRSFMQELAQAGIR